MLRMRWTVVFCLLISIGGCQPSASTRQNTIPDYITGPTEMSRVAGGYELTNRLYRLVISDQTGDVTFWGFVDHNRNLLSGRGIYTTLTGLPETAPHGTIEKRDEQTWQFYGEDDNHILWRKIYCLNGDALAVSIQIQNTRPEDLITTEQIKGELPGLKITHHDPELLEGAVDHTAVLFRGYNEFPAPTSRPANPVLIQSDPFHLKPQERQSYTTQWKLSSP
jgi:hypothetical protein